MNRDYTLEEVREIFKDEINAWRKILQANKLQKRRLLKQ